MKKPVWSEEEDEILRAFYPMLPARHIADALQRPLTAIYRRAFRLDIKKPDGWVSAYTKQNHSENGKAARFKPGMVPWNKGKKGLQQGGVATQFKPGQLNGRAATRVQPVGAERVTEDGVRQRKVRADGPFQRRWESVHSLLWAEHNGPIPPGHVVVFRDRNRENIVIENLELVTRQELMARNTLHNYSPEIVAAVQMRAALNRRINREQQDNR